MCLDIPVEPCQTLPCVWNWEALARLSWCGPVVTVPGRNYFTGALLVG